MNRKQRTPMSELSLIKQSDNILKRLNSCGSRERQAKVLELVNSLFKDEDL